MRAVAVFVTFALTVLAGCGKSASTTTSPVAKKVPIWARHVTPDGACSAEFPQKPDASEVGLLLQRFDANDSFFGTSYFLRYDSVVPAWLPVSDGSILEAVRDGCLNNTANPSELVAERKIVVGGCPGWEYESKSGQEPFALTTRVRLVVKKGTLYLFGAFIGLHEQDKLDAQRFIDSFRFEVTKP